MIDHIARWLKYIIIALAAVLFLLLIFFIHEYFVLRRAQIVGAREFWTSAFIHHHGAPTPQEAALIAPWMTFGYVNTAFKLPPDYLQGQFSISDPRYPQVTLGNYAKSQDIPAPSFDMEVQTAVRDYLLIHPATNAAPATGPSTTNVGAAGGALIKTE